MLDRLGTEELVVRFARKFPADTSYTQLCEAMAQGDAETAFRAAHTLKGLCLNLGFESLYKVDAALTEELRAGNQEFASAAEQTRQALVDMHLPELDWFMEHCLTAFGKNLDQLDV